jgi:hypothetical protein
VTTHSTENITEAVRMYLAGARIDDILAATGLSAGVLYYYLDGGAEKTVSAPRRRSVVRKQGDATTIVPRHPLTARLWRAATRSAREIERRLAAAPADEFARRQDLLMLGQLVRTLREIAALDGLAKNAETMRERARQREADDKHKMWEAQISLAKTVADIAEEKRKEERERQGTRIQSRYR